MSKPGFSRDFPEPVDSEQDLEFAFGCFPALAATGFAAIGFFSGCLMFAPSKPLKAVFLFILSAVLILGWVAVLRVFRRPNGIWFGLIAAALVTGPALLIGLAFWTRRLHW